MDKEAIDRETAENARYKAISLMIEAYQELSDAADFDANTLRVSAIDMVSGEVLELTEKMKMIQDGLDPWNDSKPFEDEKTSDTNLQPMVIFVDSDPRARYQVEPQLDYLLGLVDSRNHWYVFNKYQGLVLATDDEIETIQSFGDEFETVTDYNGDVYAAVLNDDGTAVANKYKLVLTSVTGTAYKFNRFAGLVELPDRSKPHGAFFNVDLI